MTIDLDELLNGTPTPEEVKDFFINEEFDEEHYLVAAIKKHLRSEEDREGLYHRDISIEDCLNGRVAGEEPQLFVDQMFGRWNEKLGHKVFGY